MPLPAKHCNAICTGDSWPLSALVGLAERRQQPRCDLFKGRSFLGCVMSAERGLQYVFDRDMFAHSIQRHCK
jgi:hypothetical protein